MPLERSLFMLETAAIIRDLAVAASCIGVAVQAIKLIASLIALVDELRERKAR
jgi:hypothetical protein